MSIKAYKNENSKINLVFIPGGPGLSSISFEKLMPLKEKCSLHFFDPMGTTSELKVTPTYSNLLNELKESIKHLDNIVLCGHSFGGIQAIDLASQNPENIKGLIAISSPVSKNAFSIIEKNFESEASIEKNEISNRLANNPTNEIYKEWFYIFRDFYFNPKKSNEHISIVTEDSVCVRNYSEAITESSQKSETLLNLKKVSIPKLFITGSLDMIMPPLSAKYEATVGGFNLEIIKNAGHFVHYECPKEVIKIISKFLT
jgi:pimeloyl-ACP methyl ester carboxylesterase